MPHLIILRGPMGSGKSTVADYLKQRLHDSDGLDLDLNADREVCRLDEVLGKENVVAEMYDGGSHTHDPGWISAFKSKNYAILSVILDAKVESCIHLVLHRPANQYSEPIVRFHYNIFHEKLKPIVSEKAGIHEISVSTENKSLQDVGQEILDYNVKK